MEHVMFLPAIHKALVAFSWMLIHSLWQGLLMAVMAGIFLILSKKSGAALRYNFMLSLFFLFLFTCVITFEREICLSTIDTPALSLKGTSFPMEGNASLFRSLRNNVLTWVGANSTLITGLWLVFFLLRGSKLISGMIYFKKVRSKDIYRPEQMWIDTFLRLAANLKIRQTIRLLESGSMKSPVVVGHFKPLVFVPLGLFSTLPADQIEAIFLHELAHIKRFDYLVNILQQLAESFFFFNPALLCVSRILKEEREFCCDEIALSQTQDKAGLVKALINFKEFELNRNSQALAFASKKSHLLRRVGNILGQKKTVLEKTELTFFSISVFALVCLITLSSVAKFERAMPKKRISFINHSISVLKLHFKRLDDTTGSKILKIDTFASGKKKKQRIRILSDSGTKNGADSLRLAPPDDDGKQPETKIKRDTLKPKYGEIEDDADRQKAAEERLTNQEDARRDKALADQKRLTNEEDARRDKALADQEGLKNQEDLRRDKELAAEQRRLNQENAKRDKSQDAKDRIQAQLDKIQADRDRIQNDIDRREEEKERLQRNKELDRENETRNKEDVDRTVLKNKKIVIEQLDINADAFKIDKEFAKNLEEQSREISEKALKEASKIKDIDTRELKIQMEKMKKYLSTHPASLNRDQKLALKLTQVQIEALKKQADVIARNAMREVAKLKVEQSKVLKQQLEQLKRQSKTEDLKKDN